MAMYLQMENLEMGKIELDWHHYKSLCCTNFSSDFLMTLGVGKESD